MERSSSQIEEETIGEKATTTIFAGGSGEAILRYLLKIVEKINESNLLGTSLEVSDRGEIIHEDRLARIVFMDGDISTVNNVKKHLGIPSYHVYRPAGRRARDLYTYILEQIEKNNVDSLKELIEKEDFNQYSMVICLAAVSGVGYVICKRLLNILQPIKPFAHLYRQLIMPSKLEPGVEDSIRFFLDEDETNIPSNAKTIIVDVDMANIVNMSLKAPERIDLRVIRDRMEHNPSEIIRYSSRWTNFEIVDHFVSLACAGLSLSPLIRDWRLPLEGNVKRLDTVDMASFIGDGKYFTLSVFNEKILKKYRVLEKVVTQGVLIPIHGEERGGKEGKFLENCSIVLPSKWERMLKDIIKFSGEGIVTGIALSDILNIYDIGIAFIRIDKKAFSEFYKKFLGVL